MAILVNKQTRVLIQGITGRSGMQVTTELLDYGTKVVAGVTPGKGGQEVDTVPVFNSIKEAIEKNGAELIIGGCLAMFPILGRGSREDMEEKLGVPVLDGSAIGFKTAELLAGLRLRHNRLGFQ